MTRVCAMCGESIGETDVMGSSGTRCWTCEESEAASGRLRSQLHARIVGAPVLPLLGLLMAMPIALFLYDSYAHREFFWLSWIPIVLGVLAGGAAGLGNLVSVLLIDRYEGMLEIRPMERGALTLSALFAANTCILAIVVGVGLSLSPSTWRWLESVVSP